MPPIVHSAELLRFQYLWQVHGPFSRIWILRSRVLVDGDGPQGEMMRHELVDAELVLAWGYWKRRRLEMGGGTEGKLGRLPGEVFYFVSGMGDLVVRGKRG